MQIKPAMRYSCEPLESRRLLSTFTWTNRGDVSDGFDATFGANAALARRIADRAVTDWQNVIQNFNHPDGYNSFPIKFEAQTYERSDGASSYGLATDWDRIENDSAIPRAGTVGYNYNANGAGWYLDPTIGSSSIPDDSNFGIFINRFAAASQNPVGKQDFYSACLYGIGGALGMALQFPFGFNQGTVASPLSYKVTRVPVYDPRVPNEIGLFVSSVPSGTYTIEQGEVGDPGINLYGGPAVGGLPTFPDDLLNGAVPYHLCDPDKRCLISDADALLLRDVYGYTITLPSQINTFYANLNTTSHFLTVQGDPGNANNTITFNGNFISDVSANGTHETFFAFLSGLDITTFSGADNVTLQDALPAQTTVFTGAGSDNVQLIEPHIVAPNVVTIESAEGSNNLAVTSSNASRWDLSQTQLTLYQSAATPAFALHYSNFFTATLNGVTTAATYNITSTPPGQAKVNGSPGNDTLNLIPDSGAFGIPLKSIVFYAGNGTDQMNWDDSPIADNGSYAINLTAIVKTYGISSENVSFDGLEQITLTGTEGADTFALNSPKLMTLNGGSGDDTVDTHLNFAGTTLTTFTYNGGDGYDSFNVDDHTYNVKSAGYATTTTQIRHDNQLTNYDSVEAVSIAGGPVVDSMIVTGLAAGTTLHFTGDIKDDLIELGGVGPARAPNFTDQIFGPVYFDGGPGINSVVVFNNDGETPNIVHLFQDSIGAYPGDTMFGPGGFVAWTNAMSAGVYTGTAADTIYARPSPDTMLSISGNLPDESPGDTLTLALANVGPYTISDPALPNGDVVSDAMHLQWGGIEEPLIIDDVAPTVIGSNFDDDTAPHAMNVQFSEYVAPLLSSNSTEGFDDPVTLGYATTPIDYDGSTDTARFAFQGNILPDGNYSATAFAAGVYDLAGNSMLEDAALAPFFHLTADANRDRMVDTEDFTRLAMHFGESGATFSRGDFNYDTVVNALDFNILASLFGTHLAPPASAIAVHSQAVPSVRAQAVGPWQNELFSKLPISQYTLMLELLEVQKSSA